MNMLSSKKSEFTYLSHNIQESESNSTIWQKKYDISRFQSIISFLLKKN